MDPVDAVKNDAKNYVVLNRRYLFLKFRKLLSKKPCNRYLRYGIDFIQNSQFVLTFTKFVSTNQRKFKYGHELITASIQAIYDSFNTKEITLSAQIYLIKFYNSHGFISVGKEYLEDDIPHIEMQRK